MRTLSAKDAKYGFGRLIVATTAITTTTGRATTKAKL
jgi:hypothetical protein